MVLVYRLLCDVFASEVSRYFGVYGVTFVGSAFSGKYWFSLAACFVASIGYAFYLNRRMDAFDVGLIFLFLVTYVPTTTVWWVTEGSNEYFIYATTFWSVTLWVLALQSRIGPTRPLVRGSRIDWIGLCYAGVLFLLGAMIWLRFGFAISLGFDSAYERRAVFNKWLPGGVFAYLFSWSVYVFCVYFIFYRKSWLFRIGGMAFIILLFSASGDKIYILIVPIFIYMMIVVQWKIAWVIAPTLSAALAGSIVFYWIGDIWIPTITQRMVISPSDISFHYAEYFKEPLAYAYSFLARFFEYPYDKLPGNMIGDAFYTKGENATAGFLADMFVNMNWWALLPLVVFFAALRRIVPPGPATVLLLPLTFQLIDTPLPTTLLTGGGGIMILVTLALSRAHAEPALSKPEPQKQLSS